MNKLRILNFFEKNEFIVLLNDKDYLELDYNNKLE